VIGGTTELDRCYFTREGSTSFHINQDEKFKTFGDTIVARFLANELVKAHVTELMAKVKSHLSGTETSGLQWTGSKTDLVELIYALQSADVLNKGKADIKLIATAFEAFLNIDLGRYYRVFQDITIRKAAKQIF